LRRPLKRCVWSDVFYVGKRDSGVLTLAGRTLADNLPQPKDFALTVLVDVKETSMGIEQLCSLSYEGDEED